MFMSKIYAQHKRPVPHMPKAANPASYTRTPSLLSSVGSRDLDAQMLAKYQQHFLENQIPTAEAEADRIAASVTNARTPEEVKSQLGEKMGADFSHVTFRTDSTAKNTADTMGARAYTSGNEVYFGSGGFDPHIAAHELVHTVQQGAVSSTMTTASTPAGGVQMFPNPFQMIRRGFQKLGNSAPILAIRSAFSKAGEFIGGKLGLKKPSKAEQAANLESAKAGDFSKLFRTDKSAVQRELVDPKTQEILISLRGGATADELKQTYGRTTTDMVNPIVRRSMSNALRRKMSDDARTQLKTAMEAMDSEMIVNTMLKPTDEQRQTIMNHYKTREDQKRSYREYQMGETAKTLVGKDPSKTNQQAVAEREQLYQELATDRDRSDAEAAQMTNAAINQNQNASDSMLRLMFLMQLGHFHRKDGDQDKMWDHTMANAFSHGARTAFLFRHNEEGGPGTDAVANAIFGDNMGQSAGVHTRAAATHYFVTPQSDQGLEGYKEKHGVGAFLQARKDDGYTHHGMNIAIGGIGNKGIAGEGSVGQTILNDGRAGHMYIGKKQSSINQAGGLLVGLESDSPYRMNQSGHMHDAAATAEDESNTGGMKADIQGDKYGGRTVDLRSVQNDQLINIIDSFTNHVNTLRDQQDQGDFQNLVKTIAGKRMEAPQLISLLRQLKPDLSHQEAIELLHRLGKV